jgi:membrane associated rhomboid family serine protease
MEPLVGIIRVRSESQAMEWSLVLASQGIAATIEAPADDHGWRLVVEGFEFARAQTSLRQYRAENRARLWVRKLPWTGLIFDWRSALWFLLLGVIFALGESRFPGLRTAGMMDNQAVWSGAWWRLFTATMLHADLGHLAANVTTGFLLLGLAMGSYGAGTALLAACLAGLWAYPEVHHGLGASGMIMGALGLLTAHSVSLLRAGLAARQLVIRGLFGGLLLLVLFGLSPQPQTDLIAHLAGFLTGGLLGGLLAVVPQTSLQRRWIDRLAEWICGGLVIVTWWLALR